MSSRSIIQRSVKSMPVTTVKQHSMTEASSDFTCSSIPQSNHLCVNNVVKDSIGLQAFRYDYKMVPWLRFYALCFNNFQDHMDMHNGVKKYTCEFCQKKFNKRNTLNNHKRLHTGIMKIILLLMSFIINSVPGEKPFICPSPGCGMTFVQRTACKTHAKKRHNIDIK